MDMSTSCDCIITLFSVVKFLVVSTTLYFPNFVRQGVEIHESTHKENKSIKYYHLPSGITLLRITTYHILPSRRENNKPLL